MTKTLDQCELEFNDWADRRCKADPVNPPTAYEIWRAVWDVLGGPRNSALSKADRELAFDIMQKEYATSGKSLYSVLDALAKRFELTKRKVEE